MKKIFLTLTLGLTTALGIAAAACPEQRSDRPATHGMVIVGTNKIYLSHLPMFHSPHDYQVLLEVELDAATKAAYLSQATLTPNALFTLAPENFVLPEMVKNPRPFQAQIFFGHFERGGQVIAEQAIVQIKQVLYFAKFNPAAKAPTTATYLLFGNVQEQFLAHLITAKPNFDQILRVQLSSSQNTGNSTSAIGFSSQLDHVPLNSAQSLQGQAPDEKTIGALVLAEIYREHGDLEQ